MVSTFILVVTLVVGISAAPQRIVGGTPTTTDQYPAIVQLEFFGRYSGWDQQCGGNILTERAVLSAAHCTYSNTDTSYNRPENHRVRAGATYRNRAGQIANVVSILNHPNYDTWTKDADICIVHLSSLLVFGPTINSVSIVTQDFNIPDNSAVVHAGWGLTSHNGKPSDVLLDVTVNTVNHAECSRRYLGITVNMICADILDVGGKDACQMDSGGPMYYQNILVGIISFGGQCGEAFLPGVSTKVASYTNWIVVNA